MEILKKLSSAPTKDTTSIGQNSERQNMLSPDIICKKSKYTLNVENNERVEQKDLDTSILNMNIGEIEKAKEEDED